MSYLPMTGGGGAAIKELPMRTFVWCVVVIIAVILVMLSSLFSGGSAAAKQCKYTVNRKKHTEMFLSYLPQTPVDSDKIWYTLS